MGDVQNMIVLLVMTDGRDELLSRTIESAEANLIGPLTRKVIHSDAGPEHLAYLADRYPDFDICGGSRLGFGGAIARAWRYLQDGPERFIFHLEDDFTFDLPVLLEDMVRVLTSFPHLVQMALRRQPWNPIERAAGGIVESDPDAYMEMIDGPFHWLEHRKFFTTNPSLIPINIIQQGWPVVPQSEGHFGIELFGSDQHLRSAFWGSRDSGSWVTHIGHERKGTGY